MFTGIVETTGVVKSVIISGSNRSFWVESPLSKELKTDQSVSHSGICLTVEEVLNGSHRVTAIDETIQKTTIGSWTPGSTVNIERCLLLNSRIDGHLVQGHVDTTAACIRRKEKDGSWEFRFQFPKKFGALIIEKGSICVEGVSLTAFNVRRRSFTVAVIPYTYEHTSLSNVQEGDQVNLEFDLIGKYLLRRLSLD